VFTTSIYNFRKHTACCSGLKTSLVNSTFGVYSDSGIKYKDCPYVLGLEGVPSVSLRLGAKFE
jgi:hypothetical protein